MASNLNIPTDPDPKLKPDLEKRVKQDREASISSLCRRVLRDFLDGRLVRVPDSYTPAAASGKLGGEK